MGATLLNKSVRTVLVPDVGEVSLLVQIYSDGSLGLRSVDDKDGTGERVALAALGYLREVLEADGTRHRSYWSRRKGGPMIMDALHVYGAAERADELMNLLVTAHPSRFPVEII